MNQKGKNKVKLEGELFVIVEETLDGEDVNICAEVNGVNIWDWLNNNNNNIVKITLEKIDK